MGKTDNKWISGTTPLYYWKDGTKLRLTDRSLVPAGASIVCVYENVEHIPQHIIDGIAEHNKSDVQLIQYRDRLRSKITDQIKFGKFQTISTKKPTVAPPSKKSGLRGIFGPIKDSKLPHISVKVFDGRSYWVDGINRPTFGTYWWDSTEWVYYNQYFYPDVYELFRYRTVNGVAISGHYQTDMIEVIPNLVNRVNPAGGYFTKLSDAGIYSCLNHNINWLTDSRNHWAYVGQGTYEQVMQGRYEGIFDGVITGGGPNTHNTILGLNWLRHIDVGVKVSETEYCVLMAPDSVDVEYSRTMVVEPEDQSQIDWWWWHDANTWHDNHPEETWPPGTIGHNPDPDYQGTIGDYGASYRVYDVAKELPFISKYAETLHLSFPGAPLNKMYCDFNLSDKTNFCMSRTKNEYTEHEDIFIPQNSSPTIEVVLIPAKWKYIMWVFGMFNTGSGFLPKWLCTHWEGTAPRVGPHIYSDTVVDDINDWGGFTNILQIYFYYNGTIVAGQGMKYDRYSKIYTPSGLKYGPVWTDQHIEDVIGSSLSLWYRLAADVDGFLPENGVNQNYSLLCPSYSAWSMPRKTGQLVAIIRVLYENGVSDYRYVYSKTDSTDDPILQAYAQTMAGTSLGPAQTINITEFYNEFPGTPVLGLEVEDDIPAPFVALYDAISTAHLGDRRVT